MPPKLDQDIYGADPDSKSFKESDRVLGVPEPTLDVWGETDERAKSESNHGDTP